MDELYFVYGTLKKGMRNHTVLQRCNAELIAEVETIEKYPMFDLGNGFPFLQNKVGVGSIIQGELYKINSRYRKLLDEFEGVPTLYKKGVLTVEIENIKYSNVNCYFITDELSDEELNQVDLFDNWEE